MQPWNVNVASSEDCAIETERRALWNGMQEKDFFFTVLEGDEQQNFATTVFFVPIDYFEEHHKMLSVSMPIMHLVPEYLTETFEGTFETKFNSVMVSNDLLRRGMVKASRFNNYIRNSYECDPTEG